MNFRTLSIFRARKALITSRNSIKGSLRSWYQNHAPLSVFNFDYFFPVLKYKEHPDELLIYPVFHFPVQALTISLRPASLSIYPQLSRAAHVALAVILHNPWKPLQSITIIYVKEALEITLEYRDISSGMKNIYGFQERI